MRLLGTALTQAVTARARELGFDRVAVGPAAPPEHAAAFDRWLDAGHAGTMDYLARTRAERVDPSRLLPGARSIVAVALNYNPAPGSATDDWRPVARYARGRDYHDVIRPRLRALAAFIDEAAGPGIRSRVAVDTSAVLERDLAAQAGLGWIGKNTNLLSPELGSYFFIGIVLTTATLDAEARQPDRCGACTACLDACPTRAFVAPYVLDASRCISYLTIEHRGDIAPELAPAVGDWVFGCDVCQEVCPWNRKAPPTREPALAASAPLGPLEALLALDDDAFRARFRGSAISRAKRRGLVRNAAVALGNRRASEARPALRRLLDDDDPVARRAAAWALERIEPVD
ncbi:MAG TPA: tRNA epoxyqueuosine(34) reductase QueG [Methylomirabilota bacterium]|jgi:epoxyqueuosine reductase|nr:tRNA epoxyqueuosine(34) reductase QueG [Methylomirabilota bacterium]